MNKWMLKEKRRRRKGRELGGERGETYERIWCTEQKGERGIREEEERGQCGEGGEEEGDWEEKGVQEQEKRNMERERGKKEKGAGIAEEWMLKVR